MVIARDDAQDGSTFSGLAAMTKTLSFAAVHFTVAFLVGYLMTGSVWVGGALALVEPACNTVAFHFHEKVWARIERRRTAMRGVALVS